VVKRTLLVVFALAAVACAAVSTSACRDRDTPTEPITLEANFVTVDNRTAQEWRNVEVWLNRYYRTTVPSIPAGSRFRTPMSRFIDSYSRPFDFRKAQLHDVRLTATLPDGKPLEIVKSFEQIGLEHTLGGAVGKKP